MKSSAGWFGVFRAIVALACGVLVVGCSQTSPEPAPEFALPISQVSATPPIPGEASAETTVPRRLRYIAVPPGEKVAGMAHARIVLKQGKRKAHHLGHTHKKTVAPVAAVKKLNETDEPAAKP